MAYADIPGRRVHYVRGGSGEPLLLVMGMGGHHRLWAAPFVELLESDFDVIAFNHRGIGESSWAEGPFTIADLADDAAALVSTVGWDSAHVFGISLGGMVSQELALRHPERVRTLTLGCTYAGTGGDLAAPGVQRYLEAGMTRDPEIAVRTAFEVNMSRTYAADPANYQAFERESLAVKVPIPVVQLQFQAVLGHDTSARLPRISAPTMVLHGTADEMLVAANAEHIAGLIPEARLELFEGAGHLFWWEKPERTAALLREHAGIAATDRH
jgi:pimeloyl-ACP methyl ester carboxylesterase